ncbi:peroxiredoxin Q/BCP [Monaibacterium marinum]|uniref:thioredoxin-dependent peroxiredoxin n=1 Tax=Pontivivens marinum TaxID=1690039 RepID=A0A2C9CVH4_9RHOB|nr:peroxiredoxin [Monaibacterium marinum]SOH94399.1 peroxiredoxin Q/BCP [Monaibacterium marinum]
MPLSIGDTAPLFNLPVSGGEMLNLADLRGAPVVLFFYPKDDTSGCTKEAISFTEALPQFDALGVKVVGCSKDTVAKHDKFTAKHALGMPLLSDIEGTACEAYGVWKEKQMYGKTYMGIERTTVLIDANGQIAQIWPKVKVAGHVDAVLDAAKQLGA